VQKEALATITPADQKISEREQKSSKKKQAEQKRTMDQYFGAGERVLLPLSKGGTPVQSILLWHLTKAATGVKGQKHNPDQNGNEKKGKEANAARKEKDSTTTTGTGNLSGKQPNSNKNNQAEEGKEAEAEKPEVDLEGFSTGLRLKGQGSRKKDKKRRAEKKTGEQVKQTEARMKIPRYRQWPDHCYLAPMQHQHHRNVDRELTKLP
jgi:hypothetical protein